jgi:dsDNA-specific endonuclease/ATPase MutS2
MQSPIVELDVHGCTVEEALQKIELMLKSATNNSIYRIRVIHGYHRGTRIREGIYRELGNGLEPKIKRIIPGDNEGITELILREY